MFWQVLQLVDCRKFATSSLAASCAASVKISAAMVEVLFETAVPCTVRAAVGAVGERVTLFAVGSVLGETASDCKKMGRVSRIA